MLLISVSQSDTATRQRQSSIDRISFGFQLTHTDLVFRVCPPEKQYSTGFFDYPTEGIFLNPQPLPTDLFQYSYAEYFRKLPVRQVLPAAEFC